MKSYGELLRETREAQGLDVSTVARETTIDSSLIKGMEEEDSSVFPAESYLTGFLRNYAEYLGISSEEILQLYHNKKLQESPVPTELLAKKKHPGVVAAVIVSIVLLLAAAAVVYYIKVIKPNLPEEPVEEGPVIHQFILGNEPLKERLYKGDQLLFPIEGADEAQDAKDKSADAASGENAGENTEEDAKPNYIILTVSSTLTSLGLDTPVGTIRTELSEENEIDIDGDGNSDIIVYVSEISMTEEARGAQTRVLLSSSAPALAVAGEGETAPSIADVIPPVQELPQAGGHKPYVILEDNRAYSFTIDAVFRGPCEFRHRIDRKNPEENYYSNGDTVTMTAFNGIRLWMSNANAVKLSIVADAHGYDIEIGRAGQVLVEDIKWIKVNGRYRLVALELD